MFHSYFLITKGLFHTMVYATPSIAFVKAEVAEITWISDIKIYGRMRPSLDSLIELKCNAEVERHRGLPTPHAIGYELHIH